MTEKKNWRDNMESKFQIYPKLRHFVFKDKFYTNPNTYNNSKEFRYSDIITVIHDSSITCIYSFDKYFVFHTAHNTIQVFHHYTHQ